MGVNGLPKFLRNHVPEAFTEKNINDYSNEVLAYDSLNSLYKFCIALSGRGLQDANGVTTSHLKMIIDITSACFFYGIIPINVFDGKAPLLKKKTIDMRAAHVKTAKNELKNAISDEDKIKYTKKSFTISSHMIPECKKLLEYIGLPYIQSPEEADSQCAALAKSSANRIKYIVSDDLDNLVFGAPYVLRNFSKKGPIEEVSLHVILNKLGISYGSFVDICILSSTDYCTTIKGIGASTTYIKIKEVVKENITVNAQIPGMELLAELLKCPKYRKKIWPQNTVDVTDIVNDTSIYMSKLIEDDRFNIMFKILTKLYLEKKKDSTTKYVIPPMFLSEYIETKLYYTETAIVEDPVQIQQAWDNKNSESVWNLPQYNNIHKFLVNEKKFRDNDITNYINSMRGFYNGMTGHEITMDGNLYRSYFSSELRPSRNNKKTSKNGFLSQDQNISSYVPSVFMSTQKRTNRMQLHDTNNKLIFSSDTVSTVGNIGHMNTINGLSINSNKLIKVTS